LPFTIQKDIAMPMLTQPAQKYIPCPVLALPDRIWPSRQITRPPIWMSTDLRDGNQALFEPMNGETKLRLFKALVAVGFKEIEVAFPAASRTDFDFVRTLIEGGHIPDDVTIEVITQAREDLIRETFEALRGVPRAIVHLYNATAPAWRRTVFGMGRAEVTQLAVRSTRLIRELASQQPHTRWTFQYSPETFSTTEPEFALSVCSAVIEAWGPSVAQPMIINLPATVEASTPNVYADQIEWMGRHLPQREAVILSVHPHNDRGTAVAAAELAVMAGAERVEGCLFGNGERTGNVDLVTLALNLYSQGVHPGLDFSDLQAVVTTATECTGLPVHARHPYAGELVFTAFSGSHQDAIRKGLAAQSPHEPWAVPYLPIDPADVGCHYEAVIRVNSQSGKGGIAYLLETAYGVVIPRAVQVAFSALVQKVADESGRELTPGALWALFQAEYLHSPGPWQVLGHELRQDGDTAEVSLRLQTPHGVVDTLGRGNGPLDATWHALASLGLPPGSSLAGYEEHAMQSGADAEALAWVSVTAPDMALPVHGAGRHPNLATASVLALVQAVNRMWAQHG